jgi:hypothetical protein
MTNQNFKREQALKYEDNYTPEKLLSFSGSQGKNLPRSSKAQEPNRQSDAPKTRQILS